MSLPHRDARDNAGGAPRMRTLFGDEPPPPVASTPRVLHVRAGEEHAIRFLAEPVGVWEHWEPSEHRSKLCRGRGCPRCPDPERKWCGYAPALVSVLREDGSRGTELRAVKLTDHALAALPIGQMRGYVCVLHRRRGAPNHPLRVREERQVQSEPPPAFDVRLSILRLYGLREWVAEAEDQTPILKLWQPRRAVGM